MATQAPKPKTSSGTFEGTDQASAERNLRQDYENMKLDEKLKKEYEGYEKSKAKKMAKGGTASARADGCAIRGKTKGKMV